jgi:predicted GTPase
VEVVPCSLGEGEVIYLVDTPGFNDSDRSDIEILLEITAWLTEAHKEKLKLS